MPKIRDCLISVWESLHDLLPESWVNSEIQRLKTEELTSLTQIDDSTRTVLVAEEGDNIVGIIFGRTGVWNVNHIGFMGVKSTYRRRGIRRNLLLKYLEDIEEKGIHKVCLNTAPSLKPAIRLYVEQGFVPEGFLRKEAYGVDIIIYSKFLK